MKKIRYNKACAVLCAMIALGLPSFASAKLVSIVKSQSSAGQPQVLVQCSARKDKSVLIKDGGKWCDSQLVNMCETREIKLANRVCQGSYARKLKELNQPQVAQEQPEAEAVASDVPEQQTKPAKAQQKEQQIDALRKEQIEIQASLLEIEEKRLALRKKELKLKANNAGVTTQ